MYLKAPSIFKNSSLLFLGLLFFSCSGEIGESFSTTPTRPTGPAGLLLVPGQIPLPSSIKSVQLYKKGNINNPPIIDLNSNQQLVLEFDELSSLSGQYRIKFTHHNQNWEPSNLPDAWVIEGINEIVLHGGTMNGQSEPRYFHYKTEFPASKLKFLISGNYLMHIYDYQSNVELFSLPFFVTESEGDIISSIETIFNIGPNGAAVDQPFGTYKVPGFVQFPQFDLSFQFVQNRFWKQAKIPGQITFVEEGEISFHLSRPNSFPSNFEVTHLDLPSISGRPEKVYAYEPNYTPPRITLKDDYLNFSASLGRLNTSEYGSPSTDRFARYADVVFRFNTSGTYTESANIYLIGDFNQWTISDRYKLRLNTQLDVLETMVLLKEGEYDYKYVGYSNRVLNELQFSETLTERPQEYMTFVYYKDPEYQYHRLLRVQLFHSR